MQNQVTQALDDILKKVPGVIGVVLADMDGTPIYTNGRFDIAPTRLCALSAVCQGCNLEIGKSLGQALSSIMAEFETIKIYHLRIGENGQLVILSKTKDAQFGLLKIEASRAISAFSPLAQEETPSESKE